MSLVTHNRSMNIEVLNFQKLDQQGVTTLVGWAEQEGWNPGPNDAEIFYQTDPDGFYGYFHEGELIAGGSIVSYGGKFGFMGLFIVRAGFRGNGIGNQLWLLRKNHLLSRLDDGAAIGMDGVVDMQPFYNQGGFEIAFRDERYEKTGSQYPVDASISNIEDSDFPEILEWDKKCFGFDRSQFLKLWIRQPGAKAFKYKSNDAVSGFAVMRKAKQGYKTGPLFASNEEVAESLYQACLNSAVGEPVYLDIPVTNSKAVDLIKKYDAKYVFECARMYCSEPPQSALDQTYGITTFELG